jgi:hypothetical protein
VIRFLLLLVALVAAGLFIAAHGARAIVVLVFVALLLTIPNTRVWQVGERTMVRLTGSRRRAAVVIMLVVIVVAVGVNVYQLVHGT